MNTRMLKKAVAIVALIASLSACARSPEPTQPSADGPALAGDFSGSGPGTLRSASTLPMIDRRVKAITSVAARITYTSTSGIDGTEHEVSGSVFVPRGPAPEGGWPVVAFGHGSTGVETECAPSLSPTLVGASEFVNSLVRAGYVVTVPDYQGLGVAGTYHPYLDATTEGNNMIDAVRAARHLVPNASSRWVAFGDSQGGQAAWAANELADAYGRDLDLLGSASTSPAANVIGLVDDASQGTLTVDQGPLLQWVLVSLKNEHPELNLDDYRRGIVTEKWDVLTSCSPADGAKRGEVAEQIRPDDLRPASPEAAKTMRDYLTQMSVPKGRAHAPMLIMYGGKDQLISTRWTQGAVIGACALGSTVEAYLLPEKRHGEINASVALDWIKQRFDGAPAQDACGTLVAEDPSKTLRR